MNLIELKEHLSSLGDQPVKIENIPEHFHVTQFGNTFKHFTDCGGEKRLMQNVTMQVWVADDIEHRITGIKLIDITKSTLNSSVNEVIIEYETNGTIGLYGLKLEDGVLKLVPTKTDCLAKDKCGITEDCSSEGCC